ncbi:MAG TPA: hypothetical protein VGO57_17445 [Verrucomicrobiae bacterium]|jgi:hypothetical protein
MKYIFNFPRPAGRAMLAGLMLLAPWSGHRCLAESQPVSITVIGQPDGSPLEPHFLGLSYEISQILTGKHRDYFNTNDRALVNVFNTLGIKSLRVGANAVDDTNQPVPQEKDIDNFFGFAGLVDAKVIYSFRLKNGDPKEAARLATHISAHYAGLLEGYSIGNEPNFYIKTFADYYALWKPQYDAILAAVPEAKFVGPSVANAPPAKQNDYPLELAERVAGGGHLAEASDHYYFLGRRNDLEKDPLTARDALLSDKVHATYETAYANIGAKLAAKTIPYRIDEMNNCARGGAKDSSDTYASTLWALDCIHWWAAHHIAGMNFHTGEFLKPDGTFGAPYYSAFVHESDGSSLSIRPQAYAYLAFKEGARGQCLPLQMKKASDYDFDAYAYCDRDGSVYVTLINKANGSKAQSASVSIRVPGNARVKQLRRMDLKQKESDPAAKEEITFGESPIDSQGSWGGRWQEVSNADNHRVTVEVAPTSATILCFSGLLPAIAYAN